MKLLGFVAVGLMLAGCSGNPLGNVPAEDTTTTTTTTTPTTTTTTIPADLAGNLKKISFNPLTDELTVQIASLDASPLVVKYTRNAALDVPGYTAFSVQDDPLDRMFIALAAVSPDKSVMAGVVADGGQFNKWFRGGYYQRNDNNPLPTTGQVSYAGTYAGITNLPSTGGQLQPVPAGTDPSLAPGQPARTTGDAFFNVNFDKALVNGSVYNRQFVDLSPSVSTDTSLPSLAMISTNLAKDGTFKGIVEFDGRPDLGTQGSYGGTIGGVAGSSMAGVVYLSNIFLSGDPRDTPYDQEMGVFVLPRCGTAGAPAICSTVKP